MLPKDAVQLMNTLSMNHRVSSWRIQGIPNLTISFRLVNTADDTAAIAQSHSLVEDKHYRAKPVSCIKRDRDRQNQWYSQNHSVSDIKENQYSVDNDVVETISDVNDSGLHTMSYGEKSWNMCNESSTPLPTLKSYDAPQRHARDSLCDTNMSSKSNCKKANNQCTNIVSSLADASTCKERNIINTNLSDMSVQAGNGNIPYTSYIECGIQTDKKHCIEHKNKRIQTQRQRFGTAYVQTTKNTRQVESQTSHKSLTHSSCMTEPSDMQDKGMETATCLMESKHIQTISQCTTRGTQYKQRYNSGETLSKDAASMTINVKMNDIGIAMEPVKVSSRYTQSHVSVKSIGTQDTNVILQSRPYAAVAARGRPSCLPRRNSPTSWFVLRSPHDNKC